MRTKCIPDPPNEPLMMIKRWQVEFCDGNHCAAALINYFQYWHEGRLMAQEKGRQANDVAENHGGNRTQDESLWQFHTESALAAGIMVYGRTSIAKALPLLVRKGILEIGRNPNPRYKFDNTRHFLFKPEAGNNFLKLRAAKSNKSSTENGSQQTVNGSQQPESSSQQTESGSLQTETSGTIQEITKEITEETSKEITLKDDVVVEKEDPSFIADHSQKQEPVKTAAAAADEDRVKTFDLLKEKFNRNTQQKDKDLLAELLMEEPSRDTWLELSVDRIQALIAEATRRSRRGQKFKTVLIELLDTEAALSNLTAATPPRSAAPPQAARSAAFQRSQAYLEEVREDSAKQRKRLADARERFEKRQRDARSRESN